MALRRGITRKLGAESGASGQSGHARVWLEGAGSARAAERRSSQSENGVAVARTNGHDDGMDCQSAADGNTHSPPLLASPRQNIQSKVILYNTIDRPLNVGVGVNSW